jgi:hypothetical protein
MDIPISFLIDSGAAVSVLGIDKLHPASFPAIKQDSQSQVGGANGQPLEVVDTVELPIIVGGDFTTRHTFVLVRHLSVDCLLGADFLTQHQAVVDCCERTLKVGPGKLTTPIMDTSATQSVTVIQTTEIPARSVLQITGCVGRDCFAPEVIVEPDDSLNIPSHLLVARSLNKVNEHNTVILQVMNTNSSSCTLWKGARIASWTPIQKVMAITEDQPNTFEQSQNDEPRLGTLEVGSQLSPAERSELQDLISEFRVLFQTPGRTHVVKHSNWTTNQATTSSTPSVASENSG